MHAIFVIFFGIFNTVLCGRIIGGRPAQKGELPFQVSLRWSYDDDHFCGGCLVTPRFILTAAHCMFLAYGARVECKYVSAVVGQLDFPITKNSVYRNCTTYTIHEKFNKKTYANDVAILEVVKDFPVDDVLISTIKLRRIPINSGQCQVSGWGTTDTTICDETLFTAKSIVSDILLVTDVDLFPPSVCKEKYPEEFQPLMLCAGVTGGGHDACEGDSGGPLVCDGLLTGVVCSGCGCGLQEYPGVYSDVAGFYPWIRATIGPGLVDITIETSTQSKKNDSIRSDAQTVFALNFLMLILATIVANYYNYLICTSML